MLTQILQRFKSGGLVFIDQALVSGTSFLSGILLARFLGLKIYGEFVLLWMVILFAMSIAQALITKPMLSILPKLRASEQKDYEGALHTAQLLLSIGAGVTCFVVLGLIQYTDWFFDISWLLHLKLSVLVGLCLYYDFSRKYCFVKKKLRWPLILDSLLFLLQVGGLCLLFVQSLLDLSQTFSVLLLVYTVLVVLSFRLIQRPNFTFSALKRIVDRHFDFSKWLLGTALLQWLCGNFFIIAGGAVLGTLAVGAVRIAQNTVGLVHVLFLSMENLVPVYAAQRYAKEGLEGLLQYLRQMTMQIGVLVISLLMVMAATAPWLISLLYGAEYAQYSYILVGFCILYLFVYIGHPLRFALRTLELTRPIFIGYVVGAIFSLLIAYPILEYWGINGLLLGMLLTQVLAQVVYIVAIVKIKSAYENHPLGSGES